ncbi:MAG: hypothetical protein VX335_02395 [Pseudomonadota bacterium]|nr:hypothetical protein [Pseudomonadota bacterium]
MSSSFNTCVIDVGSPKLGNIGWCLKYAADREEQSGDCLNSLVDLIVDIAEDGPIILGLDAPLSVPIRDELILATKGRSGEGRRPWSAGAGAQVLAMNLPIMTYIFKRINSRNPTIKYFWHEQDFSQSPGSIFLFEALISGKDKGDSHIADAKIMADYCHEFSKRGCFPSSILEADPKTAYYLNLVAASLLSLGIIDDVNLIRSSVPIYKPS